MACLELDRACVLIGGNREWTSTRDRKFENFMLRLVVILMHHFGSYFNRCLFQ